MRANFRETYPTPLYTDKKRLSGSGYPDGAFGVALRRQNPLASTLVFRVSSIFDREIHCSDNPCIHRARSKLRDEDALGCLTFFIVGLVTCSLSRTPRPPAKL